MRRTRNYDQEDGQEAHEHGAVVGGGGQSASPFPFAASAASDSQKSSASTATSAESAPCRTCTDFRTWMKMQKKASAAGEDEQKRSVS